MLTPKEVRSLWIADLEANADKQGKKWLSCNGKQCCLGRLCLLAIEHGIITQKPACSQSYCSNDDEEISVFNGEVSVLPQEVADWAGLTRVSGGFYDDEHGQWDLWRLNDIDGKTFPEIAAVIKAEPEGLCKLE